MISLKRKIKLTVFKGGEPVFVSGDLRVDFVVDNIVGNALNTARLTVYNLSPDVVKTISLRDAPMHVKLEVGHATEARLTTLFEGDLINIHHTPLFQDTLTQLWCWQKGAAPAQEPPIPAKTFSNMTVEAIATSIVSSLVSEEGEPTASISFEKAVGNDKDRLVPSFVYRQSAEDALRDLLARYNLQYNLINGIFHVSNILTKEGQEQEIVVKIDDGVHYINPILLKKPVEFSIATAKVYYNLTPEIEPLDFMKVENTEELQSTLSYSEGLLKLAEGVTNLTPRDYYQILKVIHRGSCYTDEWETEIHGIIYVNSIKD